MKTVQTIFLMILIIGLALPGFCAERELQTEQHRIKVGDAQSVEGELEFHVGKLSISGGSADLLNGDFAYNVPHWKPYLNYDVTGKEGELVLDQPDAENDDEKEVTWDDAENTWDLQFSNDIPLDFELEIDAGQGTLDFADLQLTDLDLSVGAGELTVYVGEQTLDDLDVDVGAGDLEFYIAGGSINDFDFEVGAGAALIDLTGDWQSDLHASIECGLGQVIVRVPDDIGVRVDAEKDWLSDLEIEDMHYEGGALVNDAYRHTDVTLYLSLEIGVGQVRIEPTSKAQY